MYFKDFPQFLYDFNYGNDKVKTSVVVDITRNIRVKKQVLANVSLYDEYLIVDGETPEIIAEKFYGTPEYHWIVMLANEKYDYAKDFPLTEPILQRHIASFYNPTLYSDDWYWKKQTDGTTRVYIRITSGQDVPFDPDYLNAPVTITLYDKTKQFVHIIDFPSENIGLDPLTQYFDFEYTESWDITQFGTGNADYGVGKIRIYADTVGREHNPVRYVTQAGVTVNANTPGAIAVTGDQIHREENDKKRRIKIVSPSLIETILRNYEDELS